MWRGLGRTETATRSIDERAVRSWANASAAANRAAPCALHSAPSVSHHEDGGKSPRPPTTLRSDSRERYATSARMRERPAAAKDALAEAMSCGGAVARP